MTRLPFLLLLLCFLLQPAVSTADETIVLTGDTQMRLGDAFMADGEYYRAITEYKKYLILFPAGRQADTALFRTGMSYFLGMEYEPAAATFASLRSRFPESPHAAEAAYQEGLCHSRLNNPDKAAAAFEAVAAMKPAPETAPKARIGQAFADFDRGDLAGARTDMRGACRTQGWRHRSGTDQTSLSLIPQLTSVGAPKRVAPDGAAPPAAQAPLS